ncbi:ABC transporter substrate-binding protein [Pseudonocardia lacus]|uniref:ABC transporter substrate-binding protein n=1 Tax=Pseudonocardia lacus TaxID=2835865 RepID=UPI001BDBF351|nr:extracellular solute-binding protein [Pseudonocardia lacus]
MAARTATGRPRIGVLLAAAAVLASTACSAGSLGSSGGTEDGTVTLTFQFGNEPPASLIGQALADDFMAANPDIRIETETRPGGTEGDNIVKTRLATGDMTDLFAYNSGSLFQAINPQQQLAPLTDEPWVGSLEEQFRNSVTAGNGVYGAPFGSSFAGGVLYNRNVYQQLGLQVPTTWEQFMANNASIEAAGIDPVIQTYGTTWTSQLFVLADYHNLTTEVPTFAEDYTANKAKYATTPAAVQGFQHLQDVHDAGYLNEDFASATFEDGLRQVAAGEGAHFPMLTVTVATMVENSPNAAQDVGFFALPGNDAAENGITAWLAAGVYVPTTTAEDSAKFEAAKRFLAFIASPAGCESATRVAPPAGPYPVEGCTLPADVPQAVKDVQPYYDQGASSPALEFVSPVKGPSLQQITVEVGSGIRSAADAAALYDQDVEKQAQQLGLPGW